MTFSQCVFPCSPFRQKTTILIHNTALRMTWRTPSPATIKINMKPETVTLSLAKWVLTLALFGLDLIQCLFSVLLDRARWQPSNCRLHRWSSEWLQRCCFQEPNSSCCQNRRSCPIASRSSYFTCSIVQPWTSPQPRASSQPWFTIGTWPGLFVPRRSSCPRTPRINLLPFTTPFPLSPLLTLFYSRPFSIGSRPFITTAVPLETDHFPSTHRLRTRKWHASPHVKCHV